MSVDMTNTLKKNYLENGGLLWPLAKKKTNTYDIL